MIELSITIPEWFLAVVAFVGVIHAATLLSNGVIRYFYFKLDKKDREGKGGKS